MFFIKFFCKENANERNESLLSNCRVQLFFYKDTANREQRCKLACNLCRGAAFFYKDTMIFAEVIYKKRTIICKKQTWFVFCDFFNFPYFKQGLFLFIFILAGNKGN